MPETVAPHIWIDAEGQAWIDRTNIPVVDVVMEHLVYGYPPEEMYYQHPQLSRAQIHAALAYYFDHQTELTPMLNAACDRRKRCP